MSKRITPEEVFRAFDITGLKPQQGGYFSDNGTCACGLGAYSVAYLGREPGCNDLMFVLFNDAGFEDNYRGCFAEGFDGITLEGACDDPIAYADGQAAWEAVKHLCQTEGEAE